MDKRLGSTWVNSTPFRGAHGRIRASAETIAAAVVFTLCCQTVRPAQLPDAHRLLSRAVHQALAMEKGLDADIHKRLERDFLLGDIAAAQCEAGDTDTALATVRSIQSQGVKDIALGRIVRVHAERGQLAAARRTVRMMQTVLFRDGAVKDIALVQAKAGDRKGAVRTAEGIQGARVRRAAFLALAELLDHGRERGLLEQALAQAGRAVEALDESHEKVEGWLAVAVVEWRLGRRAEALATFRRARRLAEAEPDDNLKAYALYHVVDAQAQVGDFDGARATTAVIPKEETDAFGAIIYEKALGRIAGGLASARQYREADRTALKIGERPIRARALAAMAEAEARAGRKAEARRHIQAALEFVGRGTDAHAILALRHVARAQIRLRDFERAEATARRIEWPARDETLAAVATAQAEAGQFRQALRTIELIKVEKWRAEAVQQLAFARVKAGDAQVLGWPEKLPSAAERGRALLGIAKAMMASRPDLGRAKRGTQ